MKCPICENEVKKGTSYCPNCGWSLVEDSSVYGTLFGKEQKQEYEARRKLYTKFVRDGSEERSAYFEVAYLEVEVARLQEELKEAQKDSEKWKKEAEKELADRENAVREAGHEIAVESREEIGARWGMETMLCGIFGTMYGFWISGLTYPIAVFHQELWDNIISFVLVVMIAALGALIKLAWEGILEDKVPRLDLFLRLLIGDTVTILGTGGITYIVVAIFKHFL